MVLSYIELFQNGFIIQLKSQEWVNEVISKILAIIWWELDFQNQHEKSEFIFNVMK